MINDDVPTAHQLRLVLTLAEELHFGRTAARLYLTQPALSQQVRTVEQRLGVQLFDRTSRRVDVTAAGRALLPIAQKVVDAADALRGAAAAIARSDQPLRLGVCESFAALNATRDVIAAIADTHPELGPNVHVSDFFVEQLSALRDGEVDAAFVYFPVPDDLHAQALTTEPRLLCVAGTDQLAGMTSVRMADLASRSVISLAPATAVAARRFWAMDPRPDGSPVAYTTHEVVRIESLLSAVSFSSAIAFVPSAVAELYPRPDLRYLEVEDLPPCTFGVVWRPGDNNTPKIAALERACRQRHVA